MIHWTSCSGAGRASCGKLRPRPGLLRGWAWGKPTAATRAYCWSAWRHLYHTAKADSRGGRAAYDTYVWQALEIAEQYTTKFDQTLAKAAPNLFMFVLYDLDPTNNHPRGSCALVGNHNVSM